MPSTGQSKPKGKGKGKTFKHLSDSVHLGDLSDLDEVDPSLASSGALDGATVYLSTDQEAEEPELWQKGGWLEPSLGRVVVCGVVVLGGLSGLGAVRSSWIFLENGGGRSG